MRRIVIIIALVAVVGIAGFILLRPKKSASTRPRSGGDGDTTGTTTTTAARATGSSRGKSAGRLKAKSKEDLKAEKDLRRREEKKRKRELRRQERERKRRLKQARMRRKGSRARRGKKGQYYTVSAIVSLGSESYALVDGRRVGVGDVVMGRRITAIMPDRLEVEAFGKTSTVRVGESLLPSFYYDKRKRS